MEAGLSEVGQLDLTLPASQVGSAAWGAQQRPSLHLQGQTKTPAWPPEGNPFLLLCSPSGEKKRGSLEAQEVQTLPRAVWGWGWERLGKKVCWQGPHP